MSERGFGWTPRVQEISFTVDMPDGVWSRAAVPVEERDVRIRLNDGDRWPPKIKRGQAIGLDLDVNGTVHRFQGRVIFRRLSTALIRGRFR